MGRSRCPVSRANGSAQRRGTPALSRRYKKRRLLPKKLSETIIEEPDPERMIDPSVKPVSTVRSCVKPVRCKSVLHLTRPAHSGNPRHTAVLASPPNKQNSGYRVPPARLPTVQTNLNPRKEEEGNLTATPETTTSSNTEEDTTFSCDVDDSDCYAAVSSSSSLSSPETFRRENCVEPLTFSMKEEEEKEEEEEEEEEQGLHLHIRNSTLLDASHAETIHMHDPPDLSTIADASMRLAEEICDIRNHKGPEVERSTQTGPVGPDKSTTKPTKPPSCMLQFTVRRPIMCKKKVSFRTPIIAETFRSKHSTATGSSTDNGTSSLVEQTRPDEETSREGEIDFKDEVPRLTVKLRRPVENSPETVKLFDFVSDSERDMLFEMMRQRSVKLKNIHLFPLTAAKVT